MLDDLQISGSKRTMFEELFDFHEKRICVGEDINVFIKEARIQLGINFPDKYDITADFVNRFEKNRYILKMLSKLMKNFRLGLLTNQYPNMLNMIFEKKLLPDDIWDVIVDSSIEKVAKPNPEIYSLAQSRASVNPENILFIDNKNKLLEPPKSMGWQVLEYDPAEPKESVENLSAVIY